MSFIYIYGNNKFSMGSYSPSDVSEKVNAFLESANCNNYLSYDEHNDVCYYSVFRANLLKKTAFSCNISKKLVSDSLFSSIPKNNIITTQADAGITINKRGECCFEHQTHKFMYIKPRDIFDHFDNWYSPNLKQEVGKIMPVPVGLYPLVAKELTPEFIQELRNIPKTKLCYCNMSITSRYRAEIAKWANKCPWVDDFIFKRPDFVDKEYANDPEIVFAEYALDFKDYMRKLASYKFAIAPEGHGIDTFRIWECVITNTIPIASNNYGNRIFSQIFPMILTDRYEMLKCPGFVNRGINGPSIVVKGDLADVNYDYELLKESNLHKLLGLIKNACNRA